MKKRANILLFAFLLLELSNWLIHTASAQNHKIDSLKHALSIQVSDSNKVNSLHSYAMHFKNINNDTALIILAEALELSKKIKWKKGEAQSIYHLGWFNYLTDKYPLALKHYQTSLELWEELVESSDKKLISAGIAGKAQTFIGFGVVYYAQSNYPTAVEYLLKALKIAEDHNMTYSKASIMGNLGNVYRDQGDHDKALEYYSKSLKIAKEIGKKQFYAGLLGNIAGVYQYMGEYKKCLEYLDLSLKAAEDIHAKESMAVIYSSIGSTYSLLNEYQRSLEFYTKSLELSREINSRRTESLALGNIGLLYTKMKKYDLAESYLVKGLEMVKQIGSIDGQCADEANLSYLYEQSGKFGLALEHYKIHILLRDSMNNERNQKQIVRSEMNFEFEKKEAVLKEQQEKEHLVAEEKDRFQKIVITSVVIGLILVIIFAAFVSRTLKQTRLQKHIIEEKQKEILDSIYYARRIQRALLTPEIYIQRHFKVPR